MSNSDLEAAYLGGHPLYVPAQPTAGMLAVREDVVRFETGGEYGNEPLFSVAWADVADWAVEGSNTAGSRSSAGRVVAGALVAGAVGALLASASKRAEYQAVLMIETTSGDRIGFAVRNMPPVAVEALIRRHSAAAAIESRRSNRPAPRGGSATAWSYRTSGLDELDLAGADGWEAVGVWVDPSGPHVLMKRPSG